MKFFKKSLAIALTVAVIFAGITYVPNVAKDVEAADDYMLVWSDEFNGNELNRNNWNVEVNGDGGGNGELQYYVDSTKNISVSDGTLKIKALKENYSNKQYTSGRINTKGKQEFKYGKIEARMKLPSFSGSWPAFWMLGANYSSVGWPKCGELDIMEAVNTENFTHGHVHWWTEGKDYTGHADYGKSSEGRVPAGYDRTQWHTYSVEWDKSLIKWYVDGIEFNAINISSADLSEFQKPEFIIFNLAIGGQWPGYTIDNTAFPDRSTMEVDYVRVYQKAPEPTTEPPETFLESEEEIDVVSNAKSNFTTYAAGENSGWAGSAVISSETMTKTGGTVHVSKVGTGIWGLQAHSPELEGIAGNTYHLSTTITSSINKQVRVKIRGNDSDEFIFFDKTLNLKANEPQTISEDVVIPSDFEGFLKLDYGYGNNRENGENLNENTSFTLTISGTSMKTIKRTYGVVEKETTTSNVTTTKSDVTTTKNTATTTASNATTTASDSTTAKSNATTTANNVVTTKSTVKTTKKLPAVKVKKATKKKSAKKIKVTLKKSLTEAKGYEVRVYKTKKNAKKNKKALVKIKTKKNKKSFKVSSKKLKNKKKLYIRVRGYKKDGKKTIYSSKWSGVKKVKIK